MIRIIVETCDATKTVHVGGSIYRSITTFDIESAELEAFLREFTDIGLEGQRYWHRNVIGAEVLPIKQDT